MKSTKFSLCKTLQYTATVLLSSLAGLGLLEFAIAYGLIPGTPIVIQFGDQLGIPNFGPKRVIQLRMHSPNTLSRYTPDAAYLARTDNLEVREYVSETDEKGFYKPGRVHARPDVVILFLGGSTTENFFMNAEQRFPHATAHILEQRTQLRINGINAGMSGNVTMHSVNNLLNFGLDERPQIAVLMENINDYAVLYHERTYWNSHPDRALIKEEWIAQTEAQISGVPVRSRAIRGFWNSLLALTIPNVSVRLHLFAPVNNNLPVQRQFGDEDQRRRWSEVKPFDLDRIAEDFSRALSTFVFVARAWDVQPVLMTQPNRWPTELGNNPPNSVRNFLFRKGIASIDYSQFKLGYDRMNDEIRIVAKRLNVPLIDLAAEISPAAEKFHDTIHLTGNGSVEAAGIIADYLAKFFDLKRLAEERHARAPQRQNR